MPLHPSDFDLALRLLLTLAAGAVFGLDRGVHNHAAGLRTTMLVGLAAASAMVLANLLITASGRSADGFVTMDVMRLPLGILTGVGFIGGGAILKRGDLVIGLTTAATLWMITVVGLCFGAGAFGLGLVATLLGFGVLSGLKLVEARLPRQHAATLAVGFDRSASPAEVPDLLERHGCRARLLRLQIEGGEKPEAHFTYEVRWQGSDSAALPDLSELLKNKIPGLFSFELKI